MDINKMRDISREQFEAKFPVPTGVAWKEAIGMYEVVDIWKLEQELTIGKYNWLWEGWQASREAAQVSDISPEVVALMKRIDAEERGQVLRAEAFVRESGRASISALQRHFKIAYGSACRLMDRLVAGGVVSPIDSEGRRQVLPKVTP